MTERQELISALVTALERRNEVLDVVANSPDAASARSNVEQLLGINEMQATAVLDTQLRRLTIEGRDRTFKELEALISRGDH